MTKPVINQDVPDVPGLYVYFNMINQDLPGLIPFFTATFPGLKATFRGLGAHTERSSVHIKRHSKS